MAIADFDTYRALSGGPLRVPFWKGPLTCVSGRTSDAWVTVDPAGATPSTSVACSSATAGAVGGDVLGAVSYGLRLLGATLSGAQTGTFMLVDRLVHHGGLNATLTTAQTTNLPTAALTRATSGEGVWAGLTVYTALGTTATTVTVSYTNQAGTSGRASKAVAFGGTGFREVSRLILLPPQTGDTGVRSVESVTVALNTGAAGNFGVTLFRPLAMFVLDRPGGQHRFSLVDGNGGYVRDINASACLSWVYVPYTTAPTLGGVLHLAEAT